MQPDRDLSGFTGVGYTVGRPKWVQALWLLVQTTVFMRWWMPARGRVAILKAFGADIGSDVLIRHRVRIHWPWKLAIEDNSWIGEGAWLLNLERITIGRNVCISQDALLCTGSHDRTSPTFEFDNAPIEVKSGAWICARAVILRGVTIHEGATVSATAIVSKDVSAHAVVSASGTPKFR